MAVGVDGVGWRPGYVVMQAHAEAEGCAWGKLKARARGGLRGERALGASGAHAKLGGAVAQAQVQEQALVVAQTVAQSKVHAHGWVAALQDARSVAEVRGQGDVRRVMGLVADRVRAQFQAKAQEVTMPQQQVLFQGHTVARVQIHTYLGGGLRKWRRWQWGMWG